MTRDRLIIDYLGRPERTGAPAWLVRVLEPDPSLPREVFVEDEEHDQLLDGSVLHVSIWTRPDGAALLARVGPLPQAEGWIQLYAADPRASSNAAMFRATEPPVFRAAFEGTNF